MTFCRVSGPAFWKKKRRKKKNLKKNTSCNDTQPPLRALWGTCQHSPGMFCFRSGFLFFIWPILQDKDSTIYRVTQIRKTMEPFVARVWRLQQMVPRRTIKIDCDLFILERGRSDTCWLPIPAAHPARTETLSVRGGAEWPASFN